MASENASLVIAKLLVGQSVDDAALLDLPQPYDTLAVTIRDRRNGLDAAAVYERELANLSPELEKEIRAAVLRADPLKPLEKPKRRGYTAGELLHADLPPLGWLVEGLVIRPGLTILGGAPKVGKSWLSLQAARAVARGETLLDRKVNGAGRVLYYALEDGPARLKDRINKAGWDGKEDAIFLFGGDLPPLDDGGMNRLEEDIKANSPALVVVDSLAAAKTAKVDENDGGQVAEVMYILSRICAGHNLSMLLIHHHRKMTTGSPLGDLRGSGAMGGAADAIMALYRERGEPECRLGLDSRDAEGFDATLGFSGTGWTLLGGGEVAEQRKADRKIIRALNGIGRGTLEEIIEKIPTGMRMVDARHILDAWINEGKAKIEISKSENGRPKKIYSLTS